MNEPVFALTTSRGFPDWLASVGGSLAFTTYEAGKLFLLGLKPDGRVSVFERSFPRAMGLAASTDGRSLFLSTQVQVFRLDNVLGEGQHQDIYDAVYAPHATWITGDIDIHDMAVGEDGRPVFVNTLFNCLATVAEGHSFRPLWRPGFISNLAAEDRCHLNGMAVEDNLPRYVTAVSASDVVDGWRDRRQSGGVVIDVQSDRVIADGLSMPHSPRLDQDRLWLLDSGTGRFGWIALSTGEFTTVAFCPGYARGMSLVGRHAVIGLSRPRQNRTFEGLALDAELARRGGEARTGLIIVDRETGAATDWVRIEGVVTELYDVAFLPGVRCPAAIGLKGSEIRTVISVAPEL